MLQPGIICGKSFIEKVGCELSLGWKMWIYLVVMGCISIVFYCLVSESSFARGETSRKMWICKDLLGFKMSYKDASQKWEVLSEARMWEYPILYVASTAQSLCMLQDSYPGSNIQCLKKTKMHLPLQAWAMVTSNFSGVKWELASCKAYLWKPCLSKSP